ncbi:type III-B CRISPR module-associated Cmr3 family protein [Pyrodictium abyssi]|uniref:Uncharacterized protein n=1 Tax=Pyrodictium abyssi TaxID=54256 RepID=A0ABN6ZUX8_9CREN|nr:hypothetical protein PABY_12700 [Pyrodictium abyssi]
MHVYKLVIDTPQPIVFRRPSDNNAAATGPAVEGATLDQPLPSTLAGLLADIARQNGLCSPRNCGSTGFENISDCLAKLLGEGYHIYSGFAVREADELLVYTPAGYKPVDMLTDPNVEPIKPPRHSRIGIALKPALKTVREGLLYTIELVDPYIAGIRYTSIIYSPNPSSTVTLIQKGLAVRFGGENRTTLLRLEELSREPLDLLIRPRNSNCKEWVLHFASPALLEESPWDKGNPVTLTTRSAEYVARLLLKNSEGQVKVKSIIIPKSIPGFEVIAPGWCTPEQRPRRPYLHVPAGTRIVLEADKHSIENIVSEGIGCCSAYGWGTVVAICNSS